MGGVLLCEVLSWGCFSLGFFSGRSLEAWCFFVSCLFLRICCWVRNEWMGDGFWCFSLRGFAGPFFLAFFPSFPLSLPLTPSLSSIYLASG